MARRQVFWSLVIIAATLALIASRPVAQGVDRFPRVLARPEPILAGQADQSSRDAIVAIAATIDASGALAGPIEILSFGDQNEPRFRMYAADPLSVPSVIERAATRATTPEYDRIRAAFDALLQWRFQPGATPVRAAFGFNFARTPESGIETEPASVAGGQAPGSDVVELVVDGAGIPVSAFSPGPVEGLSMKAVEAALRSRFAADRTYSRRLLTITPDFRRGSLPGEVSGAPPSPPTAPTGPVRVGGNIAMPTKTKDAAPVMPEVARRARVQGTVILEITVGTDGKVQDAKILRSIPLLDQAALDCVRQWEYTPILLNGTPVPVIMTATVNFTLD